MKLILLLFSFLISSACLGNSKTQVDLLTAFENKSITVKANSKGGLGMSNMKITIQNLQGDSSFIKIPPGLHFKSRESSDQDLFTVNEVLLALAPKSRITVEIQGFCMQASKYSPNTNGSYALLGYADSDLKGLADKLYQYDPLIQHYGQMFVWAITDDRSMYDVSVDSSLVEAATAVVKYVAEVTGREMVKVLIESKTSPQPRLEVFSRKSALAFHNPTEQILSFHMYDKDGNIMHTLYSNRKQGRGIKVHEFGMNDMVPEGSEPVYFFKVITTSGKVMAEMQVDRSTTAKAIEPELLNFRFLYELKVPVKEAKLRIYLQDGTLLEEFKRYTNLQPGNYAIDIKFLHLYPADTQFVARMESPDGSVHKEQTVSRKK